MQSYAKASYASMLGLEMEQPNSHGPCSIEIPGHHKSPVRAYLVVTPSAFLAYWSPGRRKLNETFHCRMDQVVALQVAPGTDRMDPTTDGRALTGVCYRSALATQSGKWEIEDATFRITPTFDRDPDENRRSVTVFFTLKREIERAHHNSEAKYLLEIHEARSRCVDGISSECIFYES
jgi:hypothetical protein